MKLYIASDIKHAKQWVSFRQICFPHIVVVSSWIDFLKDGEPPGLTDYIIKDSWRNNITDLALCDALMLYYEDGDSLRGSLFEAGIAFAMEKPIMFVGDKKALGTVAICFSHSPTLDDAVTAMHEVLVPASEVKH